MGKTSMRRNMIYSIIKSVSAIIFPMITFPYISRVLLAENVGKINFSNSVVSYFGLLASLGITTYAVRTCANQKKDSKKLSIVASEIYSINICMTAISMFLMALCILIVPKFDNYAGIILVQSLSFVFTTIGTDWINTAMEDLKYITYRTFFFQCISLLLMFTFVRNPEDYYIYVIITVLAASGSNICNVIYRRKYCKIHFTYNMNLKRHFKPIIQLFAMLLAQQIFVNSDITILGFLRNDYEVGQYSTAVKIYNIVNTLIGSIVWVVMPKLTVAFKQDDSKELQKTLSYAYGFMITLGLPCAFGMWACADSIVEVMAGSTYMEVVPVLKILAISLLGAIFWGMIMNMILLPSGKDSGALKACVISAVVNIVLNLIFIRRFGMYAAAVSTAISQFLGGLCSLKYIDRRIKIENFKNVIIGSLVGSIAIVFICYTIKKYIEGALLELVISIFSSVVLYIFIQLLLKNKFCLDIITPVLRRKRKH